MHVSQQFTVGQVSIILSDVALIVRDVACGTEVVTMEEESLLHSRIIRDVTITSLRVIRIALLIPVDGCSRCAALLIVVLFALPVA